MILYNFTGKQILIKQLRTHSFNFLLEKKRINTHTHLNFIQLFIHTHTHTRVIRYKPSIS